jgi:hypothetical protein
MKLKSIEAFDHSFDIIVQRDKAGESITVKLDNGTVIMKKWDGKAPLEISLR